MLTFCVVCLVVIIIIWIIYGLIFDWPVDPGGGVMILSVFFGVIVGLIVAVYVGQKMPTVQMTETYQLAPIYSSEDGDPIYLKAILEGGVPNLLYRVDQEGIPREETVRTYNNSVGISYDAGESTPWVEHTWVEYEKDSYSEFGIGLKSDDIYIFHLHNEEETSVRLDDLLK